MRLTSRRLIIGVATGALLAPIGVLALTADAATSPPPPPEVSKQACAHGVPSSGFTDIAADVQKDNITCIAAYNITTGKTATTYAPQQTVIRQQMALFLYNLLAATDKGAPPTPSSCPFTDIKSSGTTDSERTAICALNGAGIAKGYDSTHFGPGDPVKRNQMASFIVRSLRYAGASFSAPSGVNYFDDDTATSDKAHNADVNDLASTGIVQGGPHGLPASDYGPGRSVTRSQMAGFLGRSLEYAVEKGLAVSKYPPVTTVYVVSPTANGVVAINQTRGYTATKLTAASVDIELFDCPQVQRQTDGSYAFPDDGGVAQAPTNTGKIATVNGAAVGAPGNVVTDVKPNNGQVTFSVTDAKTDCVTPVVFARGTGTNPDALPLGSKGTPTVDYGVGGRAEFVPPEAGSGTFNQANPLTKQPGSATVQLQDTAFRYFVEGDKTYLYKSGDTYQLWNAQQMQCASSTMSEFQKRISVDDLVGGDYEPKGTSTFCLDDAAPAPPAGVKATTGTVTNGKSGAGVTVSWTDSTTATVVHYNVYRAPASPPAITGAPSTCPSFGSSYSLVGTPPDSDPSKASSAGYSFADISAIAGSGTSPSQYCYVVTSVDDGGQNGAPSSTAGPVAGANGNTAPAFTNAMAGGTTVTVFYDEAISLGTSQCSNCADAPTAGWYVVTAGSAGDAINSATASDNGPKGTGMVVLTVATAIPDGTSVKVTLNQSPGSSTHPACAYASTTACQDPSDSVSTTAGPHIDASNPATKASFSAMSITLMYSDTLLCSTVDADASDYTINFGGNDLPPGSYTATCDSGTETTSSKVVLKPRPGVGSPPPNTPFTVTAKIGGDDDVVSDVPGNQEPPGDSFSGMVGN